MNPLTEAEIRNIIREELASFVGSDRFTFQKHLQILDARHIQVGKTTGTKIGTEITQKIGFYGVTPVIQQSIGTIAGGAAASDGTARGGVNAIIAVLKSYGLTA